MYEIHGQKTIIDTCEIKGNTEYRSTVLDGQHNRDSTQSKCAHAPHCNTSATATEPRDSSKAQSWEQKKQGYRSWPESQSSFPSTFTGSLFPTTLSAEQPATPAPAHDHAPGGPTQPCHSSTRCRELVGCLQLWDRRFINIQLMK